MISKTSPLRVAIIRNYETKAQWGDDMVESWKMLITSLVEDAEFELFSPITNMTLPEADQFNLIVLTGGVFNLTLPEVDPWVNSTLEFIRKTAQASPATKIVGTCWGHQVISLAMGGKIGWNPYGDRVGVTTGMKLTVAGESFFTHRKRRDGKFALPEFHKRRVEAPPPDFTALAEDNEILLSDNNNIISFQGHPEMTALVGRGILSADDGAYTGHLANAQVDELRASFENPHDGIAMFQSVIEWCN